MDEIAPTGKAEELRDRLLFAVMTRIDIDTEKLPELKTAFQIILNEYSVTRTCEELVPYTGGKNEYLIKKFLLAKAVSGCTKGTLRAYGTELTRILEAIGKDADQITSQDIQYFIAVKMRDGATKSYANTMRLYLSSFFSYLAREELIAKNPMMKVEKIKFRKKEETAFSEIEVEKIRAACNTGRERAAVEMLLSTGCRIAELVSIRVSDIKDGVVNILGKGEKYRNIYLNARAVVAVEAYLNERRDQNPYLFPMASICGMTDENAAAFRKAQGDWYKDPANVKEDGPCRKDSISATIKKIGKRAGVDNVHPHRFRRTCATLALRHGMPIEQVSKMLGHAQIATTQIYLDLQEDELAQAHRKYVY